VPDFRLIFSGAGIAFLLRGPPSIGKPMEATVTWWPNLKLARGRTWCNPKVAQAFSEENICKQFDTAPRRAPAVSEETGEVVGSGFGEPAGPRRDWPGAEAPQSRRLVL